MLCSFYLMILLRLEILSVLFLWKSPENIMEVWHTLLGGPGPGLKQDLVWTKRINQETKFGPEIKNEYGLSQIRNMAQTAIKLEEISKN